MGIVSVRDLRNRSADMLAPVAQGESFTVEELDLDEHQALVVQARPRYYTQAQSSFDIQIVREAERHSWRLVVEHEA